MQWSDGEPFTAEDVAFTFNDVVLNPDLGAQSASQFNVIETVEIIDEHTVRFVLKRPFSALPYYLASYAGLLPEHVLGDAENPLTVAEFNKADPVTTGPFKVAEFVPGSYVRLEANPLYWDGAPKLAGMIFRIIPDANTQVAQALAGQLDVVTRLSPNVIAEIERSGRLEVLRQSQNLFFFVAPNHDDPRFEDVRVKRALLMAIDRQAMIDAILSGFGRVSSGPVAPMLGALVLRRRPRVPVRPRSGRRPARRGRLDRRRRRHPHEGRRAALVRHAHRSVRRPGALHAARPAVSGPTSASKPTSRSWSGTPTSSRSSSRATTT